MLIDANCGGCTSATLTIEHWKECPGVQCKCLHFRRQHNHRTDKTCRRCKCRGLEPVIGFDEFYEWSRAVRPKQPIVSDSGEIVRPKDLSPEERRLLQGWEGDE